MPRVPPVTTLVLHTWREHCKPKPWEHRPGGSDGEDAAGGGGAASDAGGGPPLPPRRSPPPRGGGERLPYRRSASVDEGLVAGGGGGGSSGRVRARLSGGSGSVTPRGADGNSGGVGGSGGRGIGGGGGGRARRRAALRSEAPATVLSPSSSEDDLTLGASWAGPAADGCGWDVPAAAVAICLPAASRAAMRRSVSVDTDLRSDRGRGDTAVAAPLRGAGGGARDAPPWQTSSSVGGAAVSSTMGVPAANCATPGHSLSTDLGGSSGAQPPPGGVSSSAPSASLLMGRGGAPRLEPAPVAPSQASAAAGAPAWSIPSRHGARGDGRRGFLRSVSSDGAGPALVAAARSLAAGGGPSCSGVLFSATASSAGSVEDLQSRGPVPTAVASVAEGMDDRLPPRPPGGGGVSVHPPYPHPHPAHPPYAHATRPPPPPAVIPRGTPRAMAVDDLHVPRWVAASPRRQVRRSASTDEALEALPPLPPRGGAAPRAAAAAAAAGDGSGTADAEAPPAPPATTPVTTGGAPADGPPLAPPVRRRRDEGLCFLGGGVGRVRPPRPGGQDSRGGASAGGGTSDGSDVA